MVTELRVALSVCMLCLFVAQAHAQAGATDTDAAGPAPQTVAADLDRKARVHFETATALFESGEYERAAEEFREAYRLSNRPQLLFNISLAYERLGKLQQAIELLRAYLVAVPETPKRGRLELRIQRMQERLDAQRAAEEEITTSAIAPAASVPKQEPTFNWLAPSVVTTASITLSGALVLAVFGPLALSEKSKQEDRCAPECSDADLKSLRTYRLTADIGLGVALAGAIAAAIWIPLDRRSHEQTNAVSAGLTPTSAHVRWSF